MNRLQNPIKYFLISIAVFSIPFFVSAQTGTIDPAHNYAWGENMGWLNFAAASGNISVTDTNLTGYFWSQNFGWVNLAPAGGGVTNTTSGTLGGTAWSQNLGYIDFTGATIDGTGKFHGTIGSSATTAGRITFDCSNCDVRTTWLPNVSPTPTPTISSGGGGGGAVFIPTPTPSGNTSTPITTPSSSPTGMTPPSGSNPSEGGSPASKILSSVPCTLESKNVVDNNIMFEPGQPGTFIRNLSDLKKVSIQFGGQNCFSKGVTFSTEQQSLSSVERPTSEAFLVGGYFFNITARGENGLLIHSFPIPLEISIQLPNSDMTGDLGIYYFNEQTRKWVIVSGAVFKNNEVDFTTNHLTKFGIFKATNTPATITTNPAAESNSFSLNTQTDKQTFNFGEKITATINIDSGSSTVESDIRITVLDSNGNEVFSDEYKRPISGSVTVHEGLGDLHLPAGDYTLQVRVLDGKGGEKDSSYKFTVLGNETKVQNTKSYIRKLGWIILIVFLVLVLLWYLIAKRRRRQKEEGMGNE